MAEHPIQGLMNVTMDKIRQMADSNILNLISKPIKTDDCPHHHPAGVARPRFGFVSASTDFDSKTYRQQRPVWRRPAGAGVNIQPVAFLMVKDGHVRTIQLSDGTNTVDRAPTMTPSWWKRSALC